MQDLELSVEANRALDLVQKLMKLAGNNTNEAEAASAMAKAMALLEAHNLDMALVGQTRADHGYTPRNDKKRAGGLYGWQRDLWKAVAELHFCRYWSIKGLERGSKYEHRILGSKVNVLSAELMAEYLQATVERLGQTWAREQGYNSVFVREAIAHREGIADRLSSRLRQTRRDRLAEEKRKRDEWAATHSTGTSLMLMDVINAEEDLNLDHLYGEEPGTNAARRAKREANARAAEEAAAALIRKRDQDEAVNPAMKAARLAREAKEAEESEAEWQAYVKKQRGRTYRPRAQTAREKRSSLDSYYEGYDKGEDISLDRQVTKTTQKAVR